MALAMSFALLQTRQVSAAKILVVIQATAVAITAITLRQPIMAISPLALAFGVWCTPQSVLSPLSHPPGSPFRYLFMTNRHGIDARVQDAEYPGPPPMSRDRFAISLPSPGPVGGAWPGIVIASLLTVLCQSQGSLALPLSVVLLSLLLAATRRHPVMHGLALVTASNGIALGVCFMPQGSHAVPIFPLFACVLLPLPLAIGPAIHRLIRRAGRVTSWSGWADMAASMTIFAAACVIPMDPLGTLFAPLLGLDGLMRSWQRGNRPTLLPGARLIGLLGNAFSLLAICSPRPIVAWCFILATLAAYLQPVLPRRWNEAAVAFLASGVVLFGLLLLTATPLLIGYFSMFAGAVLIGAIVPDIAVVLVIVILRLANQAAWPLPAQTLGAGIAAVSLLACAAWLLTARGKPAGLSPVGPPLVVLQLSVTAIAALAICTGQPDGRFAGLVMLVLLLLTRAAARDPNKPVSTLAVAGLGGVPLLTMFPGLLLVISAIADHAAWLMLPLGLALIPILAASLPERFPDVVPAVGLPSIGWLPLILALLIGYLTPHGLARWCQMLTAGH